MSKSAPRILVFQHIEVEHPGIFRDFLAADGIVWEARELDIGESIPSLDEYDALWVMGGPMDVWHEAEHPWLVAEKQAIRAAVLTRGLPYLGFCLGHQLLAAALGGEVGLAAEREVGVMPVTQTGLAAGNPFMRGLPSQFDVLQWHSAEVVRAPATAKTLAASPCCAIQAMSIGHKVFSMQFHVEITATTVAEWNAVPAYREALVATLGADGAAGLAVAAAAQMEVFNRYAFQLYRNWKTAAFG